MMAQEEATATKSRFKMKHIGLSQLKGKLLALPT